MTRFSAIIMAILFSSVAIAQSEWTDGMKNPEANFYETQHAFNNYWEGKTIGKGKGWKQFKRWEAFMEPRVNTDGTFPTHQLYKEWEKIRYQQRSSVSLEANWEAYGPTDVPLQSGGGKRGVGRVNVVEFNPNNPNEIWVGAPAGGLWKSTDGGLNWSSNTDLLPNLGVSDIAIDPTNTDIMYIATGDRDAGDTYAYGIMKSIDGGGTWESTGLSFNVSYAYRGNRILINPNNTNILIVSTRKSGYGETYRTMDGGDTWDLVLQGPNLVSMEFMPGNSNIIHAATTGNSKYYRSNDNGVTWSTTSTTGLPTSGNNRGLIGVTPINPDVVYLLYSKNDDGYGGLWKSTDGGLSFNMQSDSPNLMGWDSDASDDGGQGWYDLAFAVSPTNENLVFVGGVNVWKSTDGGVNWNISSHWYGGGGTEYMHADEHMLRYNPANGILYSGNDGGLYKSTNNGNNWTDISDGLQISQFYKIGISQTNADLLLAGAQDNGTLRGNSAHDWDAVRGGDGMDCAIDPSDASIMYSTIYYGALDISYDGGNSWNNIAPSDDGAWVTPFKVDQNNPNRIVAGYTMVYESYNKGASWDTISATFNGGEKLDAMALSLSNPEVIYVAESEKIYSTIDGGLDWNFQGTGFTYSNVTDLEVHPSNPQRVWASYSGYTEESKVFYSTDGGDNWTNITYNLPNLPANALAYYNTNETMFVGTDIGVWYMDSTMSEWEIFNQGMPHVVVTDLEIQHTANKLYAGTFGRGVWVTDLPPTQAPTANFAYNTLGGCTGGMQFNNLSALGTDFEWSFGDGATSNNSSPEHYYTADGSYTVTLIASNYLGSDTLSQTISIAVSEPPITTNGYSCESGAITLSATANDASSTLNWYADISGGTPLATGDTYTTPVLSSSTTYYVQESVLGDAYFSGPANQNVLGNGGYHYNDNWRETFSCTDPTLLKSITFYAETNFSIEVELRDNNDDLLDSYTANLTSGTNVVEVNFSIPMANGLTIGINGDNQGLWRNNEVTDYPIAVGNNIVISESTAGEEFFYYFYNWEVQEYCSSLLAPVEANIGSELPLTIAVSNNCPYDSLQLDATDGFNTYSWSTAETTNNITIFTPGVYELTAYDDNGCIATASYTVPYINSFTASTGNQNLCQGTPAYIQADNGYLNYLWNTGDNTNVLTTTESGTYSVTAEDANGCTLSTSITVAFMPTDMVAISVTPDSAYHCIGTSILLTANGSNTYVWNQTATGNTYSESFNSLGEEIFSVLATDVNGCQSVDTAWIQVVNCHTSIAEWLSNPVTIFPNPTNGQFVVEHQSAKGEIKNIRLTDARGRIVMEKAVAYQNGHLSEQFRLNKLAKGVYLLQLSSPEGQLNRKIILQ